MALPGRELSWKQFGVSLKDEWKRDQVGNAAGALTFFSILALFPFLLFLISLASLVIDPQQTKALLEELAKVAPEQATAIIRDRVNSLITSNSTGLVTLGAIAAIWAASSGAVALSRALNTVYGVQESRPFWKVRGMAVFMTFVAAGTIIAAAVLAVFTPVIAAKLGPAGEVLTWLRLPIAGVLMMFLWALVYYFLPDVEQRFRFITPGSVVGVLLWVAASWGFSVYVQNFGKYDATYGTLGGVVVMLLWMWISTQVLLLGAEINAILEHKSPDGKRAGAQEMAESGTSGTKTEEELSGARLPTHGGAPSARERAQPSRRSGQLAAPPVRPAPRKGAVKAGWLAVVAGVAYLFGRRSRRLV